MESRIIYFYKEEDTCYRQRNSEWKDKRKQRRQTDRHDNREQERPVGGVYMQEKEIDEAVRIFFCGIPEYFDRRFHFGRFWGKKAFSPVAWNGGQLLRLLQNCCEQVSADSYYLEEHFEKELAEEGFALTSGRQRMCGGLLRKLTGECRGIDSILYVAGEEEKQGELPLQAELLRKLHAFFYMGEKSENFFWLEENLWQEYGMPLIQMRRMQELNVFPIRRLLLLDDRQDGEAIWQELPERCVYLDLWSNQEKQREIAGNRTDVKYLSEYLYITKMRISVLQGDA